MEEYSLKITESGELTCNAEFDVDPEVYGYSTVRCPGFSTLEQLQEWLSEWS